jgi:hypothetical protein
MRWNRMAVVCAALLFAAPSAATLVPRLSLEELVHSSDVIVHGRIARSWIAWDQDRKLIWTHYSLEIHDPLKLSGPQQIVVSEPGGILDGIGMQVSGATSFVQGEEVIVFLHRTPSGYLRMTGWGQGKYSVATDAGTGQKRLRAHRESTLSEREPASLTAFKDRIRSLLKDGR